MELPGASGRLGKEKAFEMKAFDWPRHRHGHKSYENEETDKDDLRLADIFLAEFELLDNGAVLVEDWAEAERRARWIRKKGRMRGALDCLIRAICDRLNADLYTHDTGI